MKNILEVVGDNLIGVQDGIFENCSIPVGTHFEIYCNPDGIDSDGTDGFSLYVVSDIEITYHDIISNSDMLEGCRVKDDEVRIDIVTNADPYERLQSEDFINISEFFTKK